VVGSAGEGGRADWFLAKLGLAALLSGNVMMFQSLQYFWPLEQLGAEVLQTSAWIMLGCSVAVYALLGVPMLLVAGRGALRGRLCLETLIGFGALAAIAFSAVETFRGGHRLYFDSGTMLLVIVSFGQYLDAESRRKALAALTPAVKHSRRTARVLRDGTMLTISPDELRAGDRVDVRAGEEIPADGWIAEGSADIHESGLTGEWRPRLVGPGDTVLAGSLAIDGALTVVASGDTETLSDRVERWVSEARGRKASIEAIADRVVSIFIPAVVAVAVLSLLAWGVAGFWGRGLQAALSVLVIACPCALGIATPLATTMALWVATTRGTLVRSGAALEALARVRALALDKTGTVTVGRPEFREFRPEPGTQVRVAESLAFAAAVESRVNHPFARAIADHVLRACRELPQAMDVRVAPGGGAEGIVSGHTVLVGNRAWLALRGIPAAKCELPEAEGSIVAVAVDGHLTGEFVLDDPARAEASAAVLALGERGISCHLLSGDRAAVVARVAAEIGCATYGAELSPRDKPARVEALRRTGVSVAMVGDGVNDAPALAAADVGIAFGPAADLARGTADVTILSNDLQEVVRLVDLSRHTFRIVKQNLAWAFGYNSVGIVIASFGLLRPVVAAVAMVLSSVFVVANSMRLRRGAATRGSRAGDPPTAPEVQCSGARPAV
jgi:heavy metal translocating P-type ATPase